ncbi:beta-ketoacyl synthase N-terminal-like domain-containing protein, partial [Burkholderia pseudomallei]
AAPAMPAEAVSRDAAAPRAEPAGARPADIAVIGMAGQFPDAPDVDAFRALLEHARDGAPGVSGGMLENRDRFDHAFFHITPDEADAMHPYQRLVLQESWKALEDAGYNPAALAGARVGVFVGAEPADYRSTTFSGSSDALIASRVSYHLNLRGPAYVVNTGCSSGAVAIHLACESLRRNESDVVLACGIFAAMGPRMLGALGQAGMLSAGGRCRSFDAGADGTAFAEGIGVVALKRLADAIADGDPIHGIVKASGVNQDGTSNGIMAPNGVAQEELIVDVYERFGIDPADIRYVEAHGTGTLFGDAVEANALVRAFRRFTERSAYCALGTVKATIGHTAAAAGVIGLIRILLSMRARRLPGMPGLGRANPMIDLDASAFSLGLVSREWPAGRDGRPRLAALNTFGHSGTNVHIVVQEPPQARARPARAADGPRVAVPLSAMDREALRRYAARLCERLEAEGATLCVGDVAHTLRVAREPMAQRIVLFASTTGELAALLRAFVDGRDSPCLLDGAVTAAARAAGLDAAQLA